MSESGKSPDLSPQNVGRLRREISDKVASNLGPKSDDILDRTEEQKTFRHSDNQFLKNVARTAIDYRHGLIREAAKDLRNEYDSLTGVFTRERFNLKLEEEFDKAIRRGEPLALIGVDLNYLSEFNNKHGHGIGDLALRKVGEILSDNSRSTDTTGRLVSETYAGRGDGGDEFEAGLPNCDKPGVLVWWDRRLPKFKQNYPELNNENISISAGFVILDPKGFENATPEQKRAYIEQQRKKADEALYLAKVRSKRGGIRGQALVDAEELDNLPADEAMELNTYRATPKKKQKDGAKLPDPEYQI